MADYQQYKPDVEIINPDGQRGEKPRPAFVKLIDFISVVENDINAINDTLNSNTLNITQANTAISNLQTAVNSLVTELNNVDIILANFETRISALEP